LLEEDDANYREWIKETAARRAVVIEEAETAEKLEAARVLDELRRQLRKATFKATAIKSRPPRSVRTRSQYNLKKTKMDTLPARLPEGIRKTKDKPR